MSHQQTIEDHLPELALHQVLANWQGDISGSPVFRVIQPWHKAELRRHAAITCIMDMEELEDAVTDPKRAMIYIPADARVTGELIGRILSRHPLEKTLFIETP